MASPQPLRRALISVLALTFLAVAVPAAAALATDPPAAAGPEVHRRTTAVPDDALRDGATATVRVAGGPELVAVTWSGSPEAGFEVRAPAGDGWGQWFELEAGDAPEAGESEGQVARSAGPAFVGRDLREVQLRVTGGAPRHVVVHAIDAEPTAADRQLVGRPATRSDLEASSLAASGPDPVTGLLSPQAVAQPPSTITRAQWQADESWRDDSGGECDGTPDYSDDIQLGTVHHTVSRNDYTADEVPALLRGIYDYHVHTNGWCDIAYNFFVDRFGRVFEGRFGGIRRPVIGGHTSGFNMVSTGVAAIGDFQTAPVPAAMYNALVEVLAFKLAYHGVDPTGSSTVTVGSNTSAKWAEGTSVTLKNIQGHRDSNKTDCPGAMLYERLPQLRNDVASTISTRGYQPAFSIDRLFAADRFATAAAIARDTFSSSSSAYLTRGDGATSFADALAANFPAGLDTAPVLLSTSTSVPAATLSALQALGVSTVHLLGGEGALSAGVADSLRSKGFTVDRVAGADRYETAAKVALADSGGVGSDGDRRTAVLSSGTSFPDALAAGGIVYRQHLPQLLTSLDALPASTSSALTELGIQHVLITGGTGAISAAVEQQVQALGMTTERVAGATRFETAVALADLAIDRYGVSGAHIDVATGLNFPDALTGGAHVGRTSSVLLLTPTTTVPSVVTGFLQRRAGSISGGDVLGGRSAVDSIVKITVEETLRPNG
jgi:putative cell wall-binding protein